jgi:hypothetical protein
MSITTFNSSNNISAPGGFAAAITPNDGADINFTSRAIYIGGAGNLSVVMSGSGNSVTFVGLAAGTVLPITVSRVMDTSTTATNIVALW